MSRNAAVVISLYPIGQFFIHRIFGYRGVILFHWLADVYDRDKCDGRSPQLPAPSTADTANSSEDSSHFIMEQIKKLQVEKRLYYQTLIDHRDFPYIVSLRLQRPKVASNDVMCCSHAEVSTRVYHILSHIQQFQCN